MTVIEKIQAYVQKYGTLTTGMLQADSSPLYASSGSIVSLVEEFQLDGCIIVTYEALHDMEIDTFFKDYQFLSEELLDDILKCIEDNIEYI